MLPCEEAHWRLSKHQSIVLAETKGHCSKQHCALSLPRTGHLLAHSHRCGSATAREPRWAHHQLQEQSQSGVAAAVAQLHMPSAQLWGWPGQQEALLDTFTAGHATWRPKAQACSHSRNKVQQAVHPGEHAIFPRPVQAIQHAAAFIG